ncbi:hypothetical protein [Carnobacterium gallinarum]|uniref:hypothetical protein n=1 Tax=Carnobacterium gallinarum TaxID=2749 RepID=UPI00146FCDE9|nr:hypothetical protein [Carnobacterium gallinarum]
MVTCKTPLHDNSDFFIACLAISFLYEPWLAKGHLTLRIPSLKLNNQLKLPPYPPAVVPPFGTDLVGFTILSKLIQAFKYTFIIAFLLSTLQLIVNFLLGFFISLQSKNTFFLLIIKYIRTFSIDSLFVTQN